MTEAEWLEKVREYEEELKGLITEFHPAYRNPRKRPDMPITAPNAEKVCDQFSSAIAKETHDDPKYRFERLLSEGNTCELVSLFNETWFGVPESRSWPPNFEILCQLCEDPPEYEGET